MFDRNKTFLKKNISRSLRILHTEASNGWGGQEIRILNEADGMRRRGHQIFILANPESELFKRANKKGFYTKTMQFHRHRFYSQVIEVKKFIETMNIDIVNTHSSKDSWISLPAARFAKNKPLVIRTRHLSTPIGKNIFTRLLYDFFPHLVITTGEAIRRQMIEVNGFNPDKIISIPTGVDTTIFNPENNHADIRLELNLAKSTPLIGSISVLRSWKGLDYFVRAVPLIIREIHDAKFIIVGEGPYRAKLEDTIKITGHADKIYFLGHREDIVDIISSFDIIVHPSYANEGVPQTILQAMAMERPVVATSLDALKEVVLHEETGIIVPPRDFEKLAEAVVRLYQDKNLAKTVSRNGRKLVEQSYSFNDMIKRIESAYMKFL